MCLNYHLNACCCGDLTVEPEAGPSTQSVCACSYVMMVPPRWPIYKHLSSGLRPDAAPVHDRTWVNLTIGTMNAMMAQCNQVAGSQSLTIHDLHGPCHAATTTVCETASRDEGSQHQQICHSHVSEVYMCKSVCMH